jgi:hypothetical protein
MIKLWMLHQLNLAVVDQMPETILLEYGNTLTPIVSNLWYNEHFTMHFQKTHTLTMRI